MIISHTGNWKQRHRVIDVIFLAVGTKKKSKLKTKKNLVLVNTFINTKALCTSFLMLVFWGLACLGLCLGWLVMNNVW